MKNGVATFSRVVLDGILFILTGNDDIHKSLDEFEIRPDPTPDHRASCPLASEKLMFPFFLALYNGSQVSIVMSPQPKGGDILFLVWIPLGSASASASASALLRFHALSFEPMD